MENEVELVEKLCGEIDTKIVHYIPRRPEVQSAENNGKTVIEYDNKNEMANIYFELAKKIIN